MTNSIIENSTCNMGITLPHLGVFDQRGGRGCCEKPGVLTLFTTKSVLRLLVRDCPRSTAIKLLDGLRNFE